MDLGRLMLCALLIGILAISGISGAGRPAQQHTSAAPVSIGTMQNVPAEQTGYEATMKRLTEQRKEEMDILESVIADALAEETTKKQALLQKVQIVERLEAQAGIEEALAYMGYTQAAAICADERVVVIMPSDAVTKGEMVPIIDTVCSVSGCEAKDVKIILAKK